MSNPDSLPPVLFAIANFLHWFMFDVVETALVAIVKFALFIVSFGQFHI